MKSMAQFRKAQVAVILTLTIPALVAAIALATDIAIFYSNWTNVQSAADAAVLAGAPYLPANPASAIRYAQACAARTGVKPYEIASTAISADRLSITISISRSVKYPFARLLGLNDGKVQAVATARLAPRANRGRAIPTGRLTTDPGTATLLASSSKYI